MGEVVALLTDAGTPGIADPGLTAVRVAVAVGAVVTGVPGPSAVTMALAVSGQPADRFMFEGFLPRKGKERTARIAAIAAESRTTVFFAAPDRLADDLADLAAAHDGPRACVVARNSPNSTRRCGVVRWTRQSRNGLDATGCGVRSRWSSAPKRLRLLT